MALSYALSIVDADGEAVTATGWSVKFYNAYGQAITVQKNIGASNTANPKFVLTAGEADTAPAGAEITLTIEGAVCNDTRYDGSLVAGGEDFKATGDFTGDDDDDDTEVWWEDYYNSIYFWPVVGCAFVLLAIGGIMHYGKPKRGGRRR